MNSRIRPGRYYTNRLAKTFFLPIYLMATLFSIQVHAHIPHDVINTVAVSDTFDRDDTVFASMLHWLLKSEDGGLTWRSLVRGLDNRHQFNSIALAPVFDTEQTLFVSADGDGIYRSNDGGLSWTKVNSGLGNLRIRRVAVSRGYHDTGLVLASSTLGGLFRTEDRGASWKESISADIDVRSIAFMDDAGHERILIGDSKGRVHTSLNAAETWQELFHFQRAGAITDIDVARATDGGAVLVIGTENEGVFIATWNEGAFRISESERSPVLKSTGDLGERITSVAVSPKFATDSTIFVSSWHGGIFRSTDGGNSWSPFNTGLTRHEQADNLVYSRPNFGDLRVVEASDGSVIAYLGTFGGLFRSSIAGNSWEELETFQSRWITALRASGATNHDFTVGLGTYGGGAYFAPNTTLDWQVGNSGLSITRITDLMFSPDFPSDHTVFATMLRDIQRSTNAGRQWSSIAPPPGQSWRRRVSHFFRKIATTVGVLNDDAGEQRTAKIGYPAGLAISPVFERDRTMFVATRRNGILVSREGGDNMEHISWPEGLFIAVTISPDFVNDRTLFLAGNHYGIYKSSDGGVTWETTNEGLPFLEEWRQALSRGELTEYEVTRLRFYTIHLAISPSFDVDGTIFLACGEGLFKSVNRGESWQRVDYSVAPSDALLGIAISPHFHEDQTLLISGRSQGLLKSVDGGRSFKPIGQVLNLNDHRILRIAFSPLYAQDGTIYAASMRELFRSRDGGESWQLVPRPVRYENDQDYISYHGPWEIVSDSRYSTSNASFSNGADSRVEFRFFGTGIRWIGARQSNLGSAEVYIDGIPAARVEQYAAEPELSSITYSVTGLDKGTHTIAITPSASSGANVRPIVIDAFDVLGGHKQSGIPSMTDLHAMTVGTQQTKDP